MINKYFSLQTLFFGVIMVTGINTVNLGPKYPPTQGEVWPKPQQQYKEPTYYKLDLDNFVITESPYSYSCRILSLAKERYSYIIKGLSDFHDSPIMFGARKKPETLGNDFQPENLFKGFTSQLTVLLTAPCEEYPSFGMDERYTLTVSKVSTLESNSIWGVLRGLESFAQLFYLTPDYNEIRINTTDITDFPTYSHRGLLLDTARHYIAVGNILKTLDAMAINKMNVFHWHIVDDQSFPYQSERFPELSERGAFRPSLVYTREDIWKVVEYARYRGIRVIPEFDVPGHTRSWGEAFPSLLTQCYSPDNEVLGPGPMDPVSDFTLDLLRDLFAEVQQWFPDKSFHLGGDEVDLDCWRSNPKLVEYMREHSLSASDLHTLFMNNVIPLLANGTNVIVWQELFDEMVPLSNDTIVQVWKSWSILEMVAVLVTGHRVLFSSNWYLSSLNDNWSDYYQWDPRQMVASMIGDDPLLANIVGGEACMWGEMVDDTNVISRVWPRASAIAERLWNSNLTRSSITATEVTFRRIEEHACRMRRRGIDAQPPSGPGFCIV